MKLSNLMVAMAAAFAFSGVASAATVSSAVPAGSVLFSDNSAEYMISGLEDKNAATLDVGDSLRGIFSIDNTKTVGSLNPATAIGAGTAYNELTGLFQVVVTSKSFAFSRGGQDFYDYVFGFDATFGKGANVIGVLYDDIAKDFTRDGCATTAGCEATATGGNVWATLGFGTGGFWSAVGAAETPGIGGVLPATTPLGTFGMGLNFITNNTGYEWNKVACFDSLTFTSSAVDVCGQGGILASGRTLPGANTPYDIFDNVDFTMNRVPEPGSLLLLGAGLLGLGSVRRKKAA